MFVDSGPLNMKAKIYSVSPRSTHTHTHTHTRARSQWLAAPAASKLQSSFKSLQKTSNLEQLLVLVKTARNLHYNLVLFFNVKQEVYSLV